MFYLSLGNMTNALKAVPSFCIQWPVKITLITIAFLYAVKCAPGTYSGNGVEPCKPCAKGSYQGGIGALSCIECTGGKSTYGPGADALDMCVGKMFYSLLKCHSMRYF